MKKRSTVFIYMLLILLLSVQAVIQPEEEVPVIWNLDGFDGIAFISFTSSDDKDLSSVELDENISRDKMLTGTASVNLNWDVVSASTVEIALSSAKGSLSAENIEKRIPWSLSIGALTEDSVMTISSDLSFEGWDRNHFPMLSLAYEALKLGGGYRIAYTRADECAVNAFLDGRISFNRIHEITTEVLSSSFTLSEPSSFEEILELDREARKKAEALC